MADERREVAIGVRSEGTTETAQELRDVAKANTELGDSAKQSATGLEEQARAATESANATKTVASNILTTAQAIVDGEQKAELASKALAAVIIQLSKEEPLEKQRQELAYFVSEYEKGTLKLMGANIKFAGSQEDVEAGMELVKARLEEVNAALQPVVSAEDAIAAGADEAAISLENMGSAAAEAGQRSAEAIENEANAIRESGNALEIQKKQLADLIAELDQLLESYIASGEAGQEQATQAATAMASVKEALSEVVSDINEQQQAWLNLRQESEAALEPTVEGLLKQADDIQQSTQNLQLQRETLTQVSSGLREMLRDYLLLGEEGRPSAERAALAITDIKARLLDIDAALKQQVANLRQFGQAGQDAGEQTNRSMLSVAAANKLAEDAIQKVWARYAEGGSLTLRSIKDVVQNVEKFRLAIIDQVGALDNATPEMIAQYEKLKAELDKIVERTRDLTIVTKDMAVGLKETGNQFAGIGIAAQQVGRYFGETGEQIGNTAGQLGFLAAGAAHARRALAEMDINTLGNSAMATGVQFAAFAAVIYGAAKAGTALADVNEQNAEATESWTTAVKNWVTGIGGYKDRLAGVYAEDQKFITDLIQIGEGITHLKFEEAARGAKNFGDGVRDFSVAFRQGQTAVDAYYLALAAGFSKEQAHQVSLTHSAEIVKFHTAAVANGREGMKLWREVIAGAQGSAEVFAAEIKNLQPDMDALTAKTLASAQAAEEAAKHHAQLADSLKQYAEQVRHAHAEENARFHDLQDQVDAEIKLNEVVNGTTKAINAKLEVLQRYVPQSDLWSVALKKNAEELKTILDKTDGLTAKERERLEVIIELAQHGATLTNAERLHAEALINSALAGEKAVGALRAETDEIKKLDSAAKSLKSTVDSVVDAHGKHETAIGKSVIKMQELLKSSKDLTSAERARYEQAITLATEIDKLSTQEDALQKARDKSTKTTKSLDTSEHELSGHRREGASATKDHANAERDLNSERETGIGISKQENQQSTLSIAYSKEHVKYLQQELEAVQGAIASGKAQGAVLKDLQVEEARLTSEIAKETEETGKATNANQVYSVWKASDIVSNKTLLESKKELLDQLLTQTDATDSATKSAQQLTVTYKDGVPVISNVAEAQAKVADKATKAAEASNKAADAMGSVRVKYEGGKIVITNVGNEVEATGAKTETMGNKAAETATRVSEATGKLTEHQKALIKVAEEYGHTAFGVDEFNQKLSQASEATAKSNEAIKTIAESTKTVATNTEAMGTKVAEAGTKVNGATGKLTAHQEALIKVAIEYGKTAFGVDELNQRLLAVSGTLDTIIAKSAVATQGLDALANAGQGAGQSAPSSEPEPANATPASPVAPGYGTVGPPSE